jgi:uncharacterized OsmC-like protein
MPEPATEAEIVNGIDVPALREALATVGANEGARKAPKTSRIRWNGDGFKLKALVRNHTFVIDEPSHLSGEDTAPNAMDYVLGALGACYATGFLLNATLQGLDIYNLEVTVDAEQDNVFTFLGLAEPDDGHSGFSRIRAKLFVQSAADPETLEAVWRQTLTTSPVGNSLLRAVRIEPELAVLP